jgi:hypothetical protein
VGAAAPALKPPSQAVLLQQQIQRGSCHGACAARLLPDARRQLGWPCCAQKSPGGAACLPNCLRAADPDELGQSAKGGPRCCTRAAGGYFGLHHAPGQQAHEVQLTTSETLDLASGDDNMSDQSDTEHDALLGLQQGQVAAQQQHQQQQHRAQATSCSVLQGLLLGARKVASRRSARAAAEPVAVLYSSPVLGLDSHSAATLQVVNDLLAGVRMPGELGRGPEWGLILISGA